MTKARGNDKAGQEVGAMLRDLAAALVQRPEDLECSAEQVGRRIAVEATPHPDDAGRMSGAGGAMYRAFSALAEQAARARGLTCHYSLRTPLKEERSRGGDTAPFKPRDDWDFGKVSTLMDDTLWRLFNNSVREVQWVHEPDKTRVHVLLEEGRKLVPDAELRDALSVVFHAVGANHGRRIYVESLRRVK